MESKQRAWESLRNDARQAEGLIERQLNVLESLSRFGRDSNSSEFKTTSDEPTSSLVKMEMTQREFDRQRNDIEVALQRFDSLLNTMVETSRAFPSESSVHSHTDRFLQLAAEMRRTLTRVTTDFQRRREKEELLFNITTDLEVQREGAGVRLLMEEQQSLYHTQRRLNHILNQADLSREKLKEQRDVFMHIEDNVMQVVQRVPFVRKILSRIDNRRRREAIVLGGLIGICMLIVVFFW